MNESDSRKVCNYPIYPTDLKSSSVKGFVHIDNCRLGGTHWTCFYLKDHRAKYFHSFGGQPDKFLINQLPTPMTYHS